MRTNTMYTVGVKDSVTQLKCAQKRNVLSLFLKEGRVGECNILVEVVPDVRTKIGERAKAISIVVEALGFEHACV